MGISQIQYFMILACSSALAIVVSYIFYKISKQINDLNKEIISYQIKIFFVIKNTNELIKIIDSLHKKSLDKSRITIIKNYLRESEINVDNIRVSLNQTKLLAAKHKLQPFLQKIEEAHHLIRIHLIALDKVDSVVKKT